jgi:hypothetical protein
MCEMGSRRSLHIYMFPFVENNGISQLEEGKGNLIRLTCGCQRATPTARERSILSQEIQSWTTTVSEMGRPVVWYP